MKMLLVFALRVMRGVLHYRQPCQHSIHTGDTVGITASTLLETPVRLFVKETQVPGLDYKYTKLIISLLILTAATSSKYAAMLRLSTMTKHPILHRIFTLKLNINNERKEKQHAVSC
mgnify:CR=1 FL=1